MSKYYDQAKQQLGASHNNKVQAMQNQLAQNQLALDQSKGGINANFDQQVNAQNLNNKLNKNTVSNAMLGRGLGNSSVAVSGLAEQDAKNSRLVGNINTSRNNALSDVDAQKAMLSQNTNNTIGQMSNDLEDQIWALARQLEDREFEKSFKNQQLGLEREKMNAQNAYNNARLAFEQQQYKDKNKEETPAEALAQLRAAMSEDPLKAGQVFGAKYAGKPGFEYVVKEAQEYAKNYKYYDTQIVNRRNNLDAQKKYYK